MSQRPPASRPASRSPPDGQRFILPPVQLRDDPQQGGRPAERPQQESEGRGGSQQLQPSPQYARMQQPPPSGEDWRTPGLSRDLGVHSILNPPEPEGSGSSSRRLSGGTTESPLSAIGPPSHFGASPSTSTTHSFSSQIVPSNTPPTQEGYGGAFSRAPRRILTPRSPARAVSAGRGAPQGTIDAHQSPFLGARGRPYVAEPGPSASSDVPPMPTPPSQQQQQHYGFTPSSSTPSIAPRRPSGPSMQAPGRTPLSQSASPSISASSHAPSSSQTSPASFAVHKGGPGAQASSSYYQGSSFASSMQQGSGMQFPGPSVQPEGPYSAPAPQTQASSLQSSSTGSSRQTSASEPIQVLTITTSQGSYQVPVDVHQASRLADEKRARNAGASARFRQRRKEKEREASTNIEKLQQQTRDLEKKMRDLEQERDYYRQERDRYRDATSRHPDMRYLATQAPPSPQTLRSGSFQGPMMQMGGPPPHPPPLGFGSESGPERAPRRRRTDTQGDFTSLPYALPPNTTLPPVQPAGYPPGHPQGPPSLPPLRIDNLNVPQTTSSSAPPTTSAGPPPFDPYSRGPYERGWPGERR
ncbi:hypothetical protein BDZ45DRAFT_377755 [Acephala macrosclerotiorum]|nr:hypothetical protein BDZ45DRAFT_377755 [Acephala macrosclerotiorum]